jgi:two-component system sensor histidine kinase/response regulator
MGGDIQCRSEINQGSTFSFSATLDVAADVQSPDLVIPGIIADAAILIVDDNATNRHILLDVLKSWGTRPVAAESATVAMTLLKQAAADGHPFRLMISDVNMPDVDGFMLAQQVRKCPEIQQTPVIMLTSGGRSGTPQKTQRIDDCCQLDETGKTVGAI